jgi:hypothetical protein
MDRARVNGVELDGRSLCGRDAQVSDLCNASGQFPIARGRRWALRARLEAVRWR